MRPYVRRKPCLRQTNRAFLGPLLSFTHKARRRLVLVVYFHHLLPSNLCHCSSKMSRSLLKNKDCSCGDYKNCYKPH
ncbi:hypothetical protein BDU57DRAFT_517511 [Ampelomyces quisqualis]|uniref:Uncharacterized protein n=1 Tax=Ampelomyces quisqualis TaxID=50730 RepID=A0A6A5QNV8_AMPQU|nr:hypothetical protein BDU57DRAFT_517511 [Ampelomyces quisqualis]